MKIFKDLYNYRELLKTSVKKDIGGKYKHSFLGVLWSFINPLLQILVYALIFPLVMKNGGSYKDYTVFMVCGLIPWAYFTTVINRASFIMIENGNILKKVYFPRSILPLSLVTSETINFLVADLIKRGLKKENIKVAVHDYKDRHNRKESLEVLPDWWCRKHEIYSEADDIWIHYMSHELVGLTNEELEEHYFKNNPLLRKVFEGVKC